MITTIVSALKGPVLSALGGLFRCEWEIMVVALELGSNLSRYAR